MWPLAPRDRCGVCLASPDGPRADRRFLSYKNRSIYPVKWASAEAGQETRRRSEAKESGSVAEQYQIWERPIGQKRGGSGVSPAPFSPIFGRPKMGPPEASSKKKAVKREKRKREVEGCLTLRPLFSASTAGRNTAAAGGRWPPCGSGRCRRPPPPAAPGPG